MSYSKRLFLTDSSGNDFLTKEERASQDNGWNPHGSNPGNVGGDFTLVRYETRNGGNYIFPVLRSRVTGVLYNQPQFAAVTGAPDGQSTFHFLAAVPTDLALYGKGATAIARCIPTNPTASLSTMFGELKRDGLPSIPTSALFRDRAHHFKALGSEYLNAEFGWRPFVSDILKLGRAVKDHHKILKQFSRDSGKLVRRTYGFPVESSTSSTALTPAQPKPALLSSYYSRLGYPISNTLVQTSTKKTWFAGAFTYHLALGDTIGSKMARYEQEANRLFGIRLTPEVLWDLAPWSWAADWVGTVGDVAHNVSAFASDGLVMRYGYIMEKHVQMRSYTLANASYETSPGPHTITQEFVTTTLVRRGASPYGFGLTGASITARQIATIAALGFSRSGSR